MFGVMTLVWPDGMFMGDDEPVARCAICGEAGKPLELIRGEFVCSDCAKNLDLTRPHENG
jgi:hypothetical protein